MMQSAVSPVTGNGSVASTPVSEREEWPSPAMDQIGPTTTAATASPSPNFWSETSVTPSNGRPADAKRSADTPSHGPEVKKRVRKSEADQRSAKMGAGQDFYCWQCHKEKATESCSNCPRSYHTKCLINAGHKPVRDALICPECQVIRSMALKPARALRSLTKEELNKAISEAVQAVKAAADPSFHTPVTVANYPDYTEKIVHPVSFLDIEKKCSELEYSTPHEMLADLYWIQHNSFVYNNGKHALTSNAKEVVRLAAAKVLELECCPDCCSNFNSRPGTWFVETCRKPHLLVMAKITGKRRCCYSFLVADDIFVQDIHSGQQNWSASIRPQVVQKFASSVLVTSGKLLSIASNSCLNVSF